MTKTNGGDSTSSGILLGVNIDHVATLRQARRGSVPDVVAAASEAMAGGADGITIHLREDRRHIQEADLASLVPKFRVNLEMAATEEMVGLILGSGPRLKPVSVCLVPEKREELTTEGGLNVVGNYDRVRAAVRDLKSSGIVVSLFVEPDPWQLDAAARCRADFVELHTGRYAQLFPVNAAAAEEERRRLFQGGETARKLGLRVNAGHGLDLFNVMSILNLTGLEELNIGFSIVARSVFTGLRAAVAEMKKALSPAPL
ncbi:MAG: pyridoxine 5'-phosphate synthase [Candidatus Hydrogenedentota bacterium]